MPEKDPGIFRAFAYAMIAVYAALGLFLILSPGLFHFLAPWQRITAGVLCIAYGLYRFSRTKDRYKHE
jgi:hypothetical protein